MAALRVLREESRGSLKDWLASFHPSSPSVREELPTEFSFRNEPARLPEYRMKGTLVDFPVVWDGERLFSAILQ